MKTKNITAKIEAGAKRLGIADAEGGDMRIAREYYDMGFRAGVRFKQDTRETAKLRERETIFKLTCKALGIRPGYDLQADQVAMHRMAELRRLRTKA